MPKILKANIDIAPLPIDANVSTFHAADINDFGWAVPSRDILLPRGPMKIYLITNFELQFLARRPCGGPRGPVQPIPRGALNQLLKRYFPDPMHILRESGNRASVGFRRVTDFWKHRRGPAVYCDVG